MRLGHPTHHRPRPLGGSSRWRAALAATVGVVVAAGLAAPAYAAPAAPTSLTLSGSAAAAGAQTSLRIALTPDGGEKPVQVDRRVGGVWQPLATVATDAAGQAEVRAAMSRRPADNVFRATHGDLTATTAVPLVKRRSTVTIGGQRRVVDERRARLRVRWRANDGQPVAGVVRVQRKDAGSRRWRPDRRVRTDADGVATFTVRPRVDTRWRAKAAANAWVKADRSGRHRLDNRPSGDRVRLPGNAPRPRVRLPRQRRAVGEGPNLTVTRVPSGIWRQMTGRSWHRGCPVGRAGLRVVRVNYWGYDGYRYRGELVANARAARAMGNALAEMYRAGHSLRAMYRVDRFGWSTRLRGADDYRSMAAGNTSAFNCRHVVNRPGVRSPHSYGTSLDINTWENPYRSATGIVPNRYWQSRSHPNVAWRSRGHAVVQIMARHGLRWTYGLGDTQHFDYVGGRGGASRPVAELHPQCDGFICE